MDKPSLAVKAGARVLVVEDEKSVRDALAKILENYGHQVVGAGDGESALASFRPGGFDIVLTDLSLPGISGWDVAREIRKYDPDVPVVILSGWDVDAEGEEYRRSGATRLLPKPVRIKDMIALIEELATGRGEV